MFISNISVKNGCEHMGMGRCMYNGCGNKIENEISFLEKSGEICMVLCDDVHQISEEYFVGSCECHRMYLEAVKFTMIFFSKITTEMFRMIQKLTSSEINSLVVDYTGIAHVMGICELAERMEGISREEMQYAIKKFVKYYAEITGYSELPEYICHMENNFIGEHNDLVILLFMTLKREFANVRFPLNPVMTMAKLLEINSNFLGIIQCSKLMKKLLRP